VRFAIPLNSYLVSKSWSPRRIVDEAREELLLVKNQALADNALSALAILSQQRASIVALIRQLAGLS
jgi:hypothetical protein